MREQEVLDQIFLLLKAPFLPRQGKTELPPLLNSPSELSDGRNEVFKTMFQLCYCLLKYSQVNYRKNQEYLAEKFGQIQEQIGFDLMAEDTMTVAIFFNHLNNYLRCNYRRSFTTTQSCWRNTLRPLTWKDSWNWFGTTDRGNSSTI